MSEGQTWYELEWGEIKPLTVVRETERCVFVLSPYARRPVRQNKCRNLFKVKADAERAQHERLKENVADAKFRLERAEKNLAIFEASRGTQ